MKRCPKCEFIYEDEQSLCDMDGVLLVLDSRTLPNHQALQTVPATAKTAPKRNRAVPAFATLILALVLAMVYYVSTQRQQAQILDIPAQPIAATTTLPPIPELKTVAEVQPAAEQPKPETAKVTAAAAPLKKATAKTTATPTKSKVDEKKEDSKVGSLLKKTGRILKKPFKL